MVLDDFCTQKHVMSRFFFNLFWSSYAKICAFSPKHELQLPCTFVSPQYTKPRIFFTEAQAPHNFCIKSAFKECAFQS
jgi:hypothetical protein